MMDYFLQPHKHRTRGAAGAALPFSSKPNTSGNSDPNRTDPLKFGLLDDQRQAIDEALRALPDYQAGVRLVKQAVIGPAHYRAVAGGLLVALAHENGNLRELSKSLIVEVLRQWHEQFKTNIVRLYKSGVTETATEYLLRRLITIHLSGHKMHDVRAQFRRFFKNAGHITEPQRAAEVHAFLNEILTTLPPSKIEDLWNWLQEATSTAEMLKERTPRERERIQSVHSLVNSWRPIRHRRPALEAA